MKTKDLICPGIILMVLIFYGRTIRTGQPWGDDFAMYIHEAENLSQGIPLHDTGYIYNPYRPVVGPRLYPPVFPAVLIPGYLIGGLQNLTPLKLEIVLFFVATLFVLWRGLGADLPPFHRAAMLAAVGFNPVLWSYKDIIMSDILFTLFLYLALAEADKLLDDPRSVPPRVWRVPLLAMLVYLCYGTRTIGIVLIPALVLLALMHWKRGGKSIAWAAGFGLIPCLIQRWLLGGEATYSDQLKSRLPELVTVIFLNVRTYAWGMSTFWENPYTKVVRDVLLVSVTIFAFFGYFQRVRTGPRMYEIFLPLYLGVILLWPNSSGARYLIPLFPLYLYYFFKGITAIKGWLQVGWAERALIPLLALVFLSYGAEFAHMDFGPFKEGIARDESAELFSFVQSQTSAKDIFIFVKPRALSLYTGRSASIYPDVQNVAQVCRYAESVRASYLIEAPALDDPKFDDFLARQLPAKRMVFSNSDFRVFHVSPVDLANCTGDPEASNSSKR